MIAVTLSPADLRIGQFVADYRKGSARAKGMQHRHGATEATCGMDKELSGVLGEIATAKWLNVHWPDFGMTPGQIDCGVCEVRSASRSSDCLILHDDVKKDGPKLHLPFVLAIVQPPLVILRGWLIGHDGIRLKYFSDPSRKNRWAYFVPPKDLRPMPELWSYLGLVAPVEVEPADA